ncbi:MAG: hypothetical protein PWP04_1541 [Candidatus Atribacteria bacterium]|nr:hypothetical protein [Candidatus Atribacteria bacterium]
MGECQKEKRKSTITFPQLLDRVAVLIPLIRGWNPDVHLAVNPGGLVLSGIIGYHLPQEVRSLAVQPSSLEILWENLGNIRGKRALLVTDRFFNPEGKKLAEAFLEERGVLSVVTLVVLGREGDFSCFPELPKETLLPWEKE